MLLPKMEDKLSTRASSWKELERQVVANGGLLTVTGEDLRRIYGAERLGSSIRDEIRKELAARDLTIDRGGGDFYQESLLRVYRRGTAAAEIIDGYKRFHPRVPNLQEDWNNPRFVELLTFGWNAGYSEPGGLGRVARVLESHGITDITADLIRGNADYAGATKHLTEPARLAWSKAVARRYFQERERELIA